MKEFVIATNNNKKLGEIQRILEPLGICAVTAKEKGVDLGDVVEDGSTFMENAYIKAKSAYDQCGLPVVADDSGLCVDALGGRPGIYSARYAGDHSPYPVKIASLLAELQDVPDEQRTAHFTCAVCCILSDDDIIRVEGRCEGSIAHAPSGDGGFGYDPVFMVNGKSFAALCDGEKDSLSHRGDALRQLYRELSKRREEQKC